MTGDWLDEGDERLLRRSLRRVRARIKREATPVAASEADRLRVWLLNARRAERRALRGPALARAYWEAEMTAEALRACTASGGTPGADQVTHPWAKSRLAAGAPPAAVADRLERFADLARAWVPEERRDVQGRRAAARGAARAADGHHLVSLTMPACRPAPPPSGKRGRPRKDRPPLKRDGCRCAAAIAWRIAVEWVARAAWPTVGTSAMGGNAPSTDFGREVQEAICRAGLAPGSWREAATKAVRKAAYVFAGSPLHMVAARDAQWPWTPGPPSHKKKSAG